MVEIRSPLQATINITHRCNLSCSYCYASGREQIDMPTGRCIDLINELCGDHGVFHLTLAGGETLLHPGIVAILRECFAKYPGIVALLSNGLHLNDDDFFAEFSEVCKELSDQSAPLNLQISLDSHIPEVNDLQRSHGDRILKAIERAISLPISLQLACVVTRNNVDVAHRIIEKYYPRVRRFHFMNIMPSRGSSRGDVFRDLCPDREKKQAFHQRVVELEKQCEGAYITKVIEPCIKDGGSMYVPGCLAGTTRIEIEPDLTVMACPMSDEVLGNLTDQTFQEMWFSEKAERIRAADRPFCVHWL
jgi:MoaA/NifB/PqqE/SkfB family radical SAM enzyme